MYPNSILSRVGWAGAQLVLRNSACGLGPESWTSRIPEHSKCCETLVVPQARLGNLSLGSTPYGQRGECRLAAPLTFHVHWRNVYVASGSGCYGLGEFMGTSMTVISKSGVLHLKEWKKERSTYCTKRKCQTRLRQTERQEGKERGRARERERENSWHGTPLCVYLFVPYFPSWTLGS